MISYPSDLAHNLLFSTNRECLAIATSIMGMLTHNFHLSFRAYYKIFFKILIINVLPLPQQLGYLYHKLIL